LTVALPTCDGRAHLEAALRGILAQEGPAFDLLVCDDRSSDASLDLVRSLAGDRARVEINSERMGLAGNWNQCFEQSRTDWVSVFHQDDVMRPGHLASHARLIASRPDLGLIAGPAQAIDAEGQPVPPSVVALDHLGAPPRVFEPGQFVRELCVENPLRCSAVTIRRAVHQELGGFDGRFRYALDWDFWLRVAGRFPIAWTGEQTVAFRWHTASETHRFKTGTADLDEQAELLDRLYRDRAFHVPDRHALRHAADRRLALGYLNRAYEASRVGDRSLVVRCLQNVRRRHPAALARCLTDPRLGARLLWTMIRA
jgi:glycosyltransferase involved in cell wall biosynthesis